MKYNYGTLEYDNYALTLIIYNSTRHFLNTPIVCCFWKGWIISFELIKTKSQISLKELKENQIKGQNKNSKQN